MYLIPSVTLCLMFVIEGDVEPGESQGHWHHLLLLRQGQIPHAKTQLCPSTPLSLTPSPLSLSLSLSPSAAVHSGGGLEMNCQSPITPLIVSDTP